MTQTFSFWLVRNCSHMVPDHSCILVAEIPDRLGYRLGGSRNPRVDPHAFPCRHCCVHHLARNREIMNMCRLLRLPYGHNAPYNRQPNCAELHRQWSPKCTACCSISYSVSCLLRGQPWCLTHLSVGTKCGFAPTVSPVGLALQHIHESGGTL